MRGIRTAGAGLGLALAASAGFAQAPAAKFGRIQPLDGSPGAVVARGQAGQPMPPPAGQPGGTGVLQKPRELPNPSVTEIRGAGGPPAATFGTPVPYGQPVFGQPIPVGPPVAVGPPSVFPTGPQAWQAAAPDLDAPLLGGAFTSPTGLLTGPDKFSVYGEFLLWFIKGPRVPVLVSTSSPQFNGVIGTGDSRAVVADRLGGDNLFPGGRFGGVYWFGCEQRWGVDANLFFLPRQTKEVVATSGTDPLLARPFFNVNQGIPFSQIVAAPGLATGLVGINTETQMWGADVSLRRFLCCGNGSRLDFLAGFRYLGLTEELSVTESFARTSDSNTSIGVPTAVFGTVTDRFRTENHFYGGQVGLVGEMRRGRWFAEGRATVALGSVHQELHVNGAQNIQFTTGAGAFPGGLLALPGANIGSFERDKFAVVPEAGLRLGFYVTPHLRLSVGYNFLYLNSVLRPGDQIDTGLDVRRISNFPLPGTIPAISTVRPAVTLRESDVFAQGISFGLQYAW